jgi:sugar lactone lactonase YvrE
MQGLDTPAGLSVDDRDGTVFVADYYSNSIVAWKPGHIEGRVVAGGNGQGDGLHQFNLPADVVVDRETHSILICDQWNRRVMRWSLRKGTTQGESVIDNIWCEGLAMDNDGALYVTDYNKHEVRRYLKGNTTGIVVAGGNGEGEGLHQLSFPYSVAVDGEGAVYVSENINNRVVKWVNGAKEGIVVAGGRGLGPERTQLFYPYGVVVDTKGTVYVAELGNRRVTRWRVGVKEGDIIAGENGFGEGAHQLAWPYGLSFDGQGNLYVADTANHRVQRFSIE